MSCKSGAQPRQEASQPASRRGFLAVAAAGLAGVVLAPGVRLIEIAQRRRRKPA